MTIELFEQLLCFHNLLDFPATFRIDKKLRPERSLELIPLINLLFGNTGDISIGGDLMTLSSQNYVFRISGDSLSLLKVAQRLEPTITELEIDFKELNEELPAIVATLFSRKKLMSCILQMLHNLKEQASSARFHKLLDGL
ncbi:hypothetical protein TRICI_001348 [Trichomonascus ciferrii]|uniref:Uncharacterized protein n=1 Tax=Trichomonascus ciferrii TaxID=44093 RepID=A0A642VCG6_9ASCO|nr:hypothetical protein TRICI_001348 [Trichomonascus ciferrii]